MYSLKVQVSAPYEIHIERGILNRLGKEVNAVLPKAEKIFLVSDTNVFPIYGKLVCDQLKSANYQVVTFVVPAGESSKSLANFGKGLEHMAEFGFKRSDAVLALGGGVVGDLAGFIASAYMRGVAVVQVPTTLLAMVDSAVGGKTAVNLQVGKNMAGVFHEPAFVITDTSILDTQTEDNMQCGLGELLKYAILCGGRIKELLLGGITPNNVEEIIYLADKYKAEVVGADEKEIGMRKLLNLGHTFGHAYERLSEFGIPHGKCVAMGLFDAIGVSQRLGALTDKVAADMKNLLVSNGFRQAENYDRFSVLEAIKADKKVKSGGSIDFAIIKDYGSCEVLAVSPKFLEEYYHEC